MGKPVSRENRKLLPADQRSKSVNGGNSRADIVSRILSFYRIQRKTVNISVIQGCNRSKSVNRLSDPIERTPQHIRGYRHLHGMSGELRVRIHKGHIFRPLKHLDHCLILVELYDTPHLPDMSVYHKLNDLIKKCILYPFQYNKRSVNTT